MNNSSKVEQWQPSPNNLNSELLGEDDPILLSFAEEYRRLSKLTDPTQTDFEAMQTILDLAQYDAALCQLIEIVDREVYQELGLPKENSSTFEAPQALVDQPIAVGRAGKVRFQGGVWAAICALADQQKTINPGQWVNIIGIRGLTLLVTPIEFG
jgi:hypothetical protein